MLLFNDPFPDIDALFSGLGSPAAHGQLTMPMDAYRRGHDVWVHIDVPGVAADSLDIAMERGILTISAQRDWQRQDGDDAYLSERLRGSYRRQVHIGDGLDTDRIEANFNDGVLTLRIPVAEAAKPRKIAITTTQPALEAATADATG